MFSSPDSFYFSVRLFSAFRRSHEAGCLLDKSVSETSATCQPILSCLGEPASCLPGSKEKSILDVPFTAAPERGGYRRAFHAGPATKGAKSPKLLNTFAFTAVPMSPDSGKLGFCGDSTGAVCAVSGEPMPAIVGGACPKACVPLQ